MEEIYWRTPRGKPQYLPRVHMRKTNYFSLDRPWTNEFLLKNKTSHKPVHVEPLKDWNYFRGDRVQILTGSDKGKQGLVKQIIQERNWILVEGLNTKVQQMSKSVYVHIRKEQPLLVTCQVQLVDPTDLQPTEIEWRYTEDGERVRVSCRTGRIIPIPLLNEETRDYKSPSLYKDQSKDTPANLAEAVTFKPQLKTFEMDIMDKMGIKEDRIPKHTYWY